MHWITFSKKILVGFVENMSFNDDSFNFKNLLIGFFGPFLPTTLGIFFTVNSEPRNYEVLALSFLILPLVAIIFLIYGYKTERKTMAIGSFVSLVFIILLFSDLFAG